MEKIMETVLQDRKIEAYDSSLRDGGQDERANFTVSQKISMARQLDRFGFHFVEGGWPGANTTDTEFFKEAKGLLQHSKLVAFGMTKKVGVRPENDDQLVSLLEGGTSIITVFGKSWTEHVRHALRTTMIANVDAIHETVLFLRNEGREVFYDAEHFFDGYLDNPEYALETLMAAKTGGAGRLVLCDTNGGNTPNFIENTVRVVREKLGDKVPFGIHVHNDGGESISSTVRAVQAGVTQVQGAVNGIGERTGNVDLTVVLPRLYLAYGYDSGLPISKNAELSDGFEISSGIKAPFSRPYGPQMAAHKGGVHGQAVLIKPSLYEKVNPILVGRERRIIGSDQGGRSNVVAIAEKYGYKLDKSDPRTTSLMNEMKTLKVLGDAQEFLLIYRGLGEGKEPFNLLPSTEIKTSWDKSKPSHVSLYVEVKGQKIHMDADSKDGAFDAFNLALLSALENDYPDLKEVRLMDYGVLLPNQEMGTGAQVQVEIEFGQNGNRWTSIARDNDEQRTNVAALIDGYKYYILQNRMEK